MAKKFTLGRFCPACDSHMRGEDGIYYCPDMYCHVYRKDRKDTLSAVQLLVSGRINQKKGSKRP